MARKLRVQYPGAIYHVMNRGDHSEIVFGDRRDLELFLATLAEACARTDWQVHSFCLMSNHFHIVLETPRANLADGMKWLMGTYTPPLEAQALRPPLFRTIQSLAGRRHQHRLPQVGLRLRPPQSCACASHPA
jgi:REP element-mobilizing transposase RayT